MAASPSKCYVVLDAKIRGTDIFKAIAVRDPTEDDYPLTEWTGFILRARGQCRVFDRLCSTCVLFMHYPPEFNIFEKWIVRRAMPLRCVLRSIASRLGFINIEAALLTFSSLRIDDKYGEGVPFKFVTKRDTLSVSLHRACSCCFLSHVCASLCSSSFLKHMRKGDGLSTQAILYCQCIRCTSTYLKAIFDAKRCIGRQMLTNHRR